jgi:hypothetical protein
VTAVDWITTPTMKMAVLTKMAYLREKISARKPEYSVPSHAPSSRMDTSQPIFDEFSV